MGDIAIVGLGKPYGHYSAPLTDYTTLFSALGGGHGGQTLTPGFIVINAAGEDVGYSTQLRTDWDPQVVADHIKSGGTWVDYCGWPFFYHSAADGTSTKLGETGWNEFTQNLGYGWLSTMNWNSSGIGNTIPFEQHYDYIRGFATTQSVDGVAFSPSLTVRGYTPMVALVHPSGGRYFWGVYTPEIEIIDSIGPLALSTPRGINLGTYTSFITQVLKGDFSGLTYTKYYQNTQNVGTATSSPSSPTKEESGGKTDAPGPSGTITTKTTKTVSANSDGSCPAGSTKVGTVCVSNTSNGTGSDLPSWVAPVGIGAGALGLLGVGVYFLERDHRRG